jgi:outer membrane immunogenic protein
MFQKLLASAAVVVALGTTAFAADLPSRYAPPVYIPPPPVFTWTGLYAGGQIGYGWGRQTDNVFNAGGTPISTIGSIDSSGVVGGAHLGYNWQTGLFVYGLEGDVNGASYQGSTFGPFAPGVPGVVAAAIPGLFGTATTAIPVQGSIRGRLGVAFDRALIYATGGLALADIHDTFTTPAFSDSFWHFRAGWTVGGGVEYAVTNNWSVRAEYRYSDFGSYNDVLGPGGQFVHQHVVENLAQVGFSYKFDPPPPPLPAPVVAKY